MTFIPTDARTPSISNNTALKHCLTFLSSFSTVVGEKADIFTLLTSTKSIFISFYHCFYQNKYQNDSQQLVCIVGLGLGGLGEM